MSHQEAISFQTFCERVAGICRVSTPAANRSARDGSSCLSVFVLLRSDSATYAMASWEHELREMFTHHDKDMSGFISKDDVLCMLLGADKDDQKDPIFKTNLKFLINVIKEADKDGDSKISFDEFKEYINKATSQ